MASKIRKNKLEGLQQWNNQIRLKYLGLFLIFNIFFIHILTMKLDTYRNKLENLPNSYEIYSSFPSSELNIKEEEKRSYEGGKEGKEEVSESESEEDVDLFSFSSSYDSEELVYGGQKSRSYEKGEEEEKWISESEESDIEIWLGEPSDERVLCRERVRDEEEMNYDTVDFIPETQEEEDKKRKREEEEEIRETEKKKLKKLKEREEKEKKRERERERERERKEEEKFKMQKIENLLFKEFHDKNDFLKKDMEICVGCNKEDEDGLPIGIKVDREYENIYIIFIIHCYYKHIHPSSLSVKTKNKILVEMFDFDGNYELLFKIKKIIQRLENGERLREAAIWRKK